MRPSFCLAGFPTRAFWSGSPHPSRPGDHGATHPGTVSPYGRGRSPATSILSATRRRVAHPSSTPAQPLPRFTGPPKDARSPRHHPETGMCERRIIWFLTSRTAKIAADTARDERMFSAKSTVGELAVPTLHLHCSAPVTALGDMFDEQPWIHGKGLSPCIRAPKMW